MYINVVLRNWRAFADLGVQRIYSPLAIYSTMWLDFPVSMGAYRFSQDPDKPIVLHVSYTPSAHLATGNLDARQLFRAGRHKVYSMSFADYEKSLHDQLNGALAGADFEAARDIAAITVNRWPHGYAYEPMDLWDNYGGEDDHAPNVVGRAQLHRISIANSDAEASAYVNGAFDAAYRAVNEQLGLSRQ